MEFNGPPNYPREMGSLVSPSKLTSEGPRPFYPAVCLNYHWDPTAILKRTLPTEYIPQSLDPRPWTKICLEYTTSGENGPGPEVDPSVVLPSGGPPSSGPANRYMEAIDTESQLRRLDRPLSSDKPLGTCNEKQYVPDQNGDMYNPRLMAPTNRNVDPRMIMEAAMPKVLISNGPYDCREKNDRRNIGLSTRMFNNTTKQDRYKLLGSV